ncbi:hypothetical protein AMECASPLE_012448 [Ameca splendens]|uniref:Uncharacterized protein n=1 Tax=Ameca splendens TaxID=208324 RepID=A0ABV1A7U8_9TELE
MSRPHFLSAYFWKITKMGPLINSPLLSLVGPDMAPLTNQELLNTRTGFICVWRRLKLQLHLQCTPKSITQTLEWALPHNPLNVSYPHCLCTFFKPHFFLPLIFSLVFLETALSEQPATLAVSLLIEA